MFKNCSRHELTSLILRVGLGLVFLVGGLSKIGQLLDPITSQAMVDEYMVPAGYVNSFFNSFIFSGGVPVTPWAFLTGLSLFELLSGVAFITGLVIRPLALIYGFLLWTFVIALPVVTAPGVSVTLKTYTSPAILVQIRDIALSGLMFVLFNLGPGAYALDQKLFKLPRNRQNASWDHLGLLLRFSLAIVFIVGGLFIGMDNIQSFSAHALIILPIGIFIFLGHGTRFAGVLAVVVLGWYMFTKFNIDKSLLGNLNSIKREFALFGAAIILSLLGGGNLFKGKDLLKLHVRI